MSESHDSGPVESTPDSRVLSPSAPWSPQTKIAVAVGLVVLAAFVLWLAKGALSILAIAGTFGTVQLVRFLGNRLDRAGTAVVGITMLALVVSLGQVYIGVQLHDKLTDRAQATEVPAGLLSAFENTLGEPDGQTVLTAEHELTVYLPVFLWNSWNANYANPAGRFHDRAVFLEDLSLIDDPERFAAAADDNDFEPIDTALFWDAGDVLAYWYTDENFPNGTIVRTIEFRRSQFDDAYWETRTDNGYVVFVRRSKP